MPLDSSEWVDFFGRCSNREREKYNKELENQAAEYKLVIQHHLSVNEKMLRDKEQLSEKCCNLAGILSIAESKVKSRDSIQGQKLDWYDPFNNILMLCFGALVVWWKGETTLRALVSRDEEGIKSEPVFPGLNW